MRGARGDHEAVLARHHHPMKRSPSFLTIFTMDVSAPLATSQEISSFTLLNSSIVDEIFHVFLYLFVITNRFLNIFPRNLEMDAFVNNQEAHTSIDQDLSAASLSRRH